MEFNGLKLGVSINVCTDAPKMNQILFLAL